MRISDWISDVCSSDLEGELGGFDHRVHELRPVCCHLRQGYVAQQRQLLQHQWALAPWAAFGDGIAVIVISRRRLDRGAPLRQIVARQQAAVLFTAGIQKLGRAVEAVHRLGYEALVPRGPCRSEEHTSELQSLMRIS